MQILFQTDQNKTDYQILKEILIHSKYLHSCVEISLKEFQNSSDLYCDYRDYIPIGTLGFVRTWLNKYHPGVEMTPIEIPECLQMPPFLKRKYQKTKANGIPSFLPCFVKDATVLKSFHGILYNHSEWLKELKPEHEYIVSEPLDILAEYRIYVIDGKIENVANYNGDVSIFPDMDLVRMAVAKYNLEENAPKSYTMDVMISKQNGTELLEIHPFCAVGLYSTLWGQNLLYAYQDGIDYYIKNCQKQRKTKKK